MFDWDDNILSLSTKILVDKFENGGWVHKEVSSADFRNIRPELVKYEKGEDSIWRYRNNDPDQAYSGFRDFGPRGASVFLEDTIDAINSKSFAPVWDDFINCLISGNIFMIITARGHEPQTIKKSVEWIIFNYLTNEQRIQMIKNLSGFVKLFGYETFDGMITNKYIYDYLELCDFLGVQSTHFQKKFNGTGSTISPERGKEIAIDTFVRKVNEYGKLINSSISVGFSDDDIGTVNHIHSYIKEKLSIDIPIEYKIFYTKDGVEEIEF